MLNAPRLFVFVIVLVVALVLTGCTALWQKTLDFLDGNQSGSPHASAISLNSEGTLDCTEEILDPELTSLLNEALANEQVSMLKDVLEQGLLESVQLALEGMEEESSACRITTETESPAPAAFSISQASTTEEGVVLTIPFEGPAGEPGTLYYLELVGEGELVWALVEDGDDFVLVEFVDSTEENPVPAVFGPSAFMSNFGIAQAGGSGDVAERLFSIPDADIASQVLGQLQSSAAYQEMLQAIAVDGLFIDQADIEVLIDETNNEVVLGIATTSSQSGASAQSLDYEAFNDMYYVGGPLSNINRTRSTIDMGTHQMEVSKVTQVSVDTSDVRWRNGWTPYRSARTPFRWTSRFSRFQAPLSQKVTDSEDAHEVAIEVNNAALELDAGAVTYSHSDNEESAILLNGFEDLDIEQVYALLGTGSGISDDINPAGELALTLDEQYANVSNLFANITESDFLSWLETLALADLNGGFDQAYDDSMLQGFDNVEQAILQLAGTSDTQVARDAVKAQFALLPLYGINIESGNAYSAGDTFSIYFDAYTNQPGGFGVQDKALVDAMFNFSHNFGVDYTGQWINPYTFEVTIVDPAGSDAIPGVTTVDSVDASTYILDESGLSGPSSSTSPTMEGELPSGWIDPTPPGPVATEEDVVWINPRDDIEINGNSLESTDRDKGRAESSQILHNGDGYVEFSITIVEETPSRAPKSWILLGETTGDRDIFLLATLSDRRTNNEEISAEVYDVTFDSEEDFFTEDDILRVEINGPDVLFKKNGVVFFSVPDVINSSSYPLMVHAIMQYYIVVENARVGGGFLPQPTAPAIAAFVTNSGAGGAPQSFHLNRHSSINSTANGISSISRDFPLTFPSGGRQTWLSPQDELPEIAAIPFFTAWGVLTTRLAGFEPILTSTLNQTNGQMLAKMASSDLSSLISADMVVHYMADISDILGSILGPLVGESFLSAQGKRDAVNSMIALMQKFINQNDLPSVLGFVAQFKSAAHALRQDAWQFVTFELSVDAPNLSASVEIDNILYKKDDSFANGKGVASFAQVKNLSNRWTQEDILRGERITKIVNQFSRTIDYIDSARQGDTYEFKTRTGKHVLTSDFAVAVLVFEGVDQDLNVMQQVAIKIESRIANSVKQRVKEVPAIMAWNGDQDTTWYYCMLNCDKISDKDKKRIACTHLGKSKNCVAGNAATGSVGSEVKPEARASYTPKPQIPFSTVPTYRTGQLANPPTKCWRIISEDKLTIKAIC